jgi:hypothetical protein
VHCPAFIVCLPCLAVLLFSCTVRAQNIPTAPARDGAASAPSQGSPTRVEISAARFRDMPGRTSLSGDELARVPGTGGDPMRAVQSLPGVATLDDASSEPAVRGSRGIDNVYFADFVPVGYLFHVGGFASVFNPSLIRRFSMSSAAWSPEWGHAVGAVFDVQLRNPRTDRLGAELDFSLLGASVLAEGPLGKDFSFFVAARRSWFDLVLKDDRDEKEGVSYTIPVYSDAQGRLLWTVSERSRLRLDFSSAKDRVDYTVEPGGRAASRDPAAVGASAIRQSFTSAAVVLEHESSNSLAHRLALGQMQQNDSFRLGAAGTAQVRTDTDYLRQQSVYTGWKGHEWTLGATLERRRVDARLDFNFPRCTEFDPNCDISSAPRLVTSQRETRDRVALHAADRWAFAPRWVAVAGLRLDRDALLDRTVAEPRLGLEYSPSDRTTWSAGLGRHSQTAQPEETVAVIGNPRLQPVRSTHAVLGLSQRFSGGWSLKTEAYAKRFDGYAVSDALLNFRNGASGRAAGVELLLKKDPTPGGPRVGFAAVTGYASLTLSRSRRTVQATGERFPFDADQPVIATVVATLPYSARWSYGLKWSAHSGSPYTPVVGRLGTFPDGRVRPLYGRINSERLPAYHRLDLRADRIFSPTLSAYFEVINAYGRKNVYGYEYDASYTQRETLEQLPLLLSFGVKAKF